MIIFNAQQVDKVSYHTVQKIVTETKLIFTNSNMKEDDCRCTKNENLKLILIATKHSLRKKKTNWSWC